MERTQQIDIKLLEEFRKSIISQAPHINEGKVVNATPLVDLTEMVYQCAFDVYGLELQKGNKIFGKLETNIIGNSIKTRPALRIIEQGITAGKIRRGSYIFEATSGNFGIALGLLTKLGVNVILIVSRKLQEGVIGRLRENGAKIIELDIDICPAPGRKSDTSKITAQMLFSKLVQELESFGLPSNVLYDSREKIEELLAREDVIELVKVLAEIYDGFCPEQYDNELNPAVHEETTAFEIDFQLSSLGYSMKDFDVICTFGTGGTSYGISSYCLRKYGRKAVRVIFPLPNQDVAGIRTKDKAVGLRFYRPELYVGEHFVDFEQAKKLLSYFVSRGVSIGESSALELYSVIQMLNYGVNKNFVVIIADGSEKYNVKPVQFLEPMSKTVDEVRKEINDYSLFLWTHNVFVPKEDGIKLLADALGVEEKKIRVLRPSEVSEALSSSSLPQSVKEVLPQNGKILVVCMAGGTSFSFARVLSRSGYNAASLGGGLIGIAQSKNIQPQQLVKLSIG